MKIYKIIIRQTTGFFLICIFAFSITPVVLLHDVAADHTDLRIIHNHTQSSEVAKAGIDCHTNAFVAEANFLFTYSPVQYNTLKNFQLIFPKRHYSFFTRHHFFAELRGPPEEA